MTSETEHDQPDGEPRRHVTELFDEYRAARDRREPPDLGGLERRAGKSWDELESRIQVFEDLSSLSNEMANEEVELPPTLGRFKIERKIGRGGLGHVYLALDPNLGRHLALKVLDRNLVPDERERAWVLNEARSLAVLEHDSIVRVFEVGHADGFDYVAIEHLTGPSLSQVLFELRRLRLEDGGLDTSDDSAARRAARSMRTPRARTQCLIQIARALAYCHNRGVIHRDIKPDNVVFDSDGVPKLIDFGLAHVAGNTDEESATRITKQLVGTAAYIAPEQVESNETGADPRSDQFSLCTLLYESFALEHPFEAPTSAQTTTAVLACEPPSLRRRAPDLPAELVTIIHHGLARNPDERYPSVAALADDLQAWLDLRPISVSDPSLGKRAGLWARRNRSGLIALGAAAMVLMLTVIGLWATGVSDRRNTIVAELDAIDLLQLTHPEAFLESGMVLQRARANAATFDAGLAHSLFGDPLELQVAGRIDAWSRQLNDAHLGSTLLAGGVGASQAPNADLPQDSNWHMIFQLEEYLCPDCPYNQTKRLAGRVFLPSEEELAGLDSELQVMEAPANSKSRLPMVYRTLSRPYPKRLPVGAYRFIAAKNGAAELAHEILFVLQRDLLPPRTIELRARLGAALPSMLAFEAAEFSLTPSSRAHRADTVWVPAFKLTPNPVTKREFEAFQRSAEYANYCDERSPGHPVNVRIRDDLNESVHVDVDAANAYCRWVGGRLPGIGEIVIAKETGLIAGEWEYTCNVLWMSNTWNGTKITPTVKYSMSSMGWGVRGNAPRYELPRSPSPDSPAAVFRVAFGVDHPSEYFQLSHN